MVWNVTNNKMITHLVNGLPLSKSKKGWIFLVYILLQVSVLIFCFYCESIVLGFVNFHFKCYGYAASWLFKYLNIAWHVVCLKLLCVHVCSLCKTNKEKQFKLFTSWFFFNTLSRIRSTSQQNETSYTHV